MKTIGLVEKVEIKGNGGKTLEVNALVDTGAKMTSIDRKIAEELNLGPVVRTFKVKSPIVKEIRKRPVVMAKIRIAGEEFEVEANVSDRSHMKYQALIGRNLIYGNFLVDVSKSPENIKQ